MKNLITTLILLVTFSLTSSFTNISNNSFRIGAKEWPLISSIIANESYGIKSKFELDLISDNEDFSKAKTFVWLSITSTTTTKLTDGVYQFSTTSLDNRAPFHFNGTVNINGQKIKITGGNFSIENQKESTDIHFILKLENGNVTNGIYSGKFSAIDRSRNQQ